jgi:mannose-6-phosphate isomerase-like protein (cupin superfamily)
MNESTQKLQSIQLNANTPHEIALERIRTILEKDLGYHFSDVDEARPWGAFYRVVDEEADRFLAEFFPGLDPIEARLGNKELVLSPKILVVYPGQRLSWQYHNYRAERWRFLTHGGYFRSPSDEQGVLIVANPDDIVQFETTERHRLAASKDGYTLVAEIWQHTNPAHPSEESDIVRVADDYKR